MAEVTISHDAYIQDNSIDVLNSLNLESMTFVLFGATGDLSKRKIFPALYNLFLDDKLPQSFSLVGIGRKNWSNYTFQMYVTESINLFSRRPSSECSNIKKFLSSFSYQPLDITDGEGYQSLLQTVQEREHELEIPENRLFYLSVAPEFINDITLNIKKSGLAVTKGWKRLIIEKPFGHDLNSARELNEKLSKGFEEDEIYRIDHYLGKPMVQNLEALELANPILRALWNNQHVANIQITASEIVGVEERAGYYDQAGAVRDMFQNHLLQLLMMIALHLPGKSSPEVISDEKRKIMESLRPLRKENLIKNIIRGQYGPGEILGTKVVGYKEEPGVAPSSMNDTFIAARVWIDNDNWKGVPFYIRTGKRMKEKSTRIVVEFKNTLDRSHILSHEEFPNLMIIEINPNEGVSLQLNMKNPLTNKFEPVHVDFSSSLKNVPEAYELLLYDAFLGDSTFFAHWKEVELSWEWIQPVLEAFKENSVPLYSYQSGSMGPEASNELLREDGFHWW